MLLERAEPGDDLRPVPDPEAALIAADVLERLWSAQPTEGLADLEEWTRVLERFAGRQHPLPIEHFARASRLRRELLADPPERVVLHGDLHHTNVLRTEDRGWLAIDPKGVTGEKAFDILMFLLNPEPVPWERNLFRIDTFVDRLKLDRQRVFAWCYVQSVVSACWTVEDNEHGWERSMRFAEALSLELA
jgi:streptomycin 6-kinase